MLCASADHQRDRLGLGPRPRAQRAPVRSAFAASPSQIQSPIVTLPRGPDDQSRRRRRPERLHRRTGQLRLRGPGHLPRQRQDRHVRDPLAALDGPLNGSIYIGQPLPGDQYRAFMIADGFGIHAKLVGSFRPDPHRPGHRLLRRPAAGARSTTSTSTSSPPTAAWWRPRPTARSTPPTADSSPGTTRCPTSHSNQIFSLDSGPHGTPARVRSGPSTPAWRPAPRTPVAGAFTDFTLQLDRDDGDQFLGDLNFTMPPGLHRQPARHRLLPGGGDRRTPRNKPGPRRAGGTELPGLEPDRHHQRRRRPRSSPLPRRRQDVPGGPVQRRPALAWRRSPRPSPAPTTTAPGGPGRPRTSIRSPPRSAPSRTRCPSIIGGIPIRMRSIRVNIDRPELHDQPDQLLPLLSRLAGDRRPGHGHGLLLLLPCRQLLDSRPSSRR